LRQDVRGRAEPVEAECLAVARHAIAAPADQPGAQKRRCRSVLRALAEWKTVPRVGDHVRGIAAVTGVAGEKRPIAKVLGPAAAIAADAAGRAEPRHADPLATRKAHNPLADRRDAADDLAAPNNRQL